MSTISVVITTKNEGTSIGALLKSIRKQNLRNFETIVVDNASSDSTKSIAKSYGAKVFDRGPERSAQRNFGVKISDSSYVIILDADMVLTKYVLTDCVEKFNKNKELGGLVIPERSFGVGFWSKCRKFEREFYLGEELIEAARCFRKAIFLKFGGYDKTITGPEDFELPLRMKNAGVKIGRIGSYIFHNEGKFSPIRSAKKKFYYAAHAGSYLINHTKVAMKQGNLLLRPVFFKKWKKLLSHPILSVGMFMVKGVEMIGALFGVVYSGIIRKEK